jgi:5-(hydroxymethyl)furfural/furfural oxidase
MGPPTDATAFVDHVGRIHGVAGLRVVDASIFPTGPRANLHCTVVAVAERLAEVIADERSEYAAHSMPWT